VVVAAAHPHDLFAAVREQLSGRRTGILRIRDEALSPATLALTVTTRGLDRLDAYLDGLKGANIRVAPP
jgi:hypothetical protein